MTDQEQRELARDINAAMRPAPAVENPGDTPPDVSKLPAAQAAKALADYEAQQIARGEYLLSKPSGDLNTDEKGELLRAIKSWRELEG